MVTEALRLRPFDQHKIRN